MANSMRKENTISVVLAKESSMHAVAPIVQATRKPLPKQPTNNTLPGLGVNAIKNNNAMEKEKVKKYKKRDLRVILEQRMREYWGDPKIKVTPMEFSRMLKTYCEKFNLSDEIQRAKELEQPLVDALSTWLGYPLR